MERKERKKELKSDEVKRKYLLKWHLKLTATGLYINRYWQLDLKKQDAAIYYFQKIHYKY